MRELSESELLEDYGNTKVKFAWYYKYKFYFKGVVAGTGEYIQVEVGGNSDDIYRFEVVSNTEYTINELYPDAGIITSKESK